MPEHAIRAEITRVPLEIGAACTFVADPAHGAVATFTGVVRNRHDGKVVTGITYDAHEVLAQAALRQICAEAADSWPGSRCYAAHYHGELPVGGISVVIAVSSPHRAEAFAACRYVIEEIKRRLPVWKQEHYADGKSDWLPGHSLLQDEATEEGDAAV